MIFSINESGDLDVSKTDKTFVNIVEGNTYETYYKQARTTNLTHFIHNSFFEEDFIKHLRNNFEEDAVNAMVDAKLTEIFYYNEEILNYVNYLSVLDEDTYSIYFFFSDGYDKRKIMVYNVTI
jgi:hypothetical protein